MTDPPHGHEESSLAALAVIVSGLRRQVESLAAGLGTLASTQREHAAAVQDAGELRHQVDKILAILTGQDDASPAGWFWLTMSDPAREEKSAELFDWVETVFREQYPDYLADEVRPCWPNHPEARWELSWLYQQWSLTYLAKHPAVKDAADWHDRWSPGVLRRLGAVMRGCETTCRRQPASEPRGHPR